MIVTTFDFKLQEFLYKEQKRIVSIRIVCYPSCNSLTKKLQNNSKSGIISTVKSLFDTLDARGGFNENEND